MHERPGFIFATCQVGAEGALKQEVAREWPDFHFAFSRPGFLTFKLPEDHGLLADFDLRSVFARAYGFSLGRVEGEEADDAARRVWELYGARPVRRLHVWRRDTRPAAERDDASPVAAAEEARQALRRLCPRPESPGGQPDQPDQPDDVARPGDFVLDCVVVEPGQWWVGYHRASGPSTCWPGGVPPIELPPDAVSRAWLKMEEALRWSELPIPRGARVAEIGCAPGGSSQALLARGLAVTGIDPAEVDPRVLAHPDFTHIRRRAMAVRRREFRKVRWVAADMNVAPQGTLDAVEDIVTHREARVRGLLLTLKLPDWKLAEHVPEYLARVRSWGYNVVRARQLYHNRQELCMAALQKPFRRGKGGSSA